MRTAKTSRRRRAYPSSAGPELWIAPLLVGVVVAVVWLITATIRVVFLVVRRLSQQRIVSHRRTGLPAILDLATPSQPSASPTQMCMAPRCPEPASHRSFDGPWTWCAQHAGPADLELNGAEEPTPEGEAPDAPQMEITQIQPEAQEPVPLETGAGAADDRHAGLRARSEELRAANPYPRPEEFHAFARQYIERLGYQITTSRPYREFDLDLVTIDPDGEKVLVRCRWEAETKRNHLETLVREMNWIGAQRAMMIACGWFGRKAKVWAEDQPLVLVDGVQIGARAPLGYGGSRS